ncbi:MAG: hypothetical protein ABSF15_25585 [Candidatus Sulfotelmatobacter sp.]|jgi:hypothetical protein
MLESKLQPAHAHGFRELQYSRVIWAEEIRARTSVQRNDDASAIQCGIIRPFDPSENLRPVRHLRLIFPKTYETRSATGSEEMEKRSGMASRDGSIDQEGRTEAMTYPVECR